MIRLPLRYYAVPGRASLSLPPLNFAATQKNANSSAPPCCGSGYSSRGLYVSDTGVMKNSARISLGSIKNSGRKFTIHEELVFRVINDRKLPRRVIDDPRYL